MRTNERAMKFLCGALLLALSTSASAVQDAGRITNLYVTGDAVGFHLDGGFPNAVASGICPTSSGYWAGKLVMEKSIAAALMTARASGTRVTATIVGCEGNGDWFRVSEVYLSD